MKRFNVLLTIAMMAMIVFLWLENAHQQVQIRMLQQRMEWAELQDKGIKENLFQNNVEVQELIHFVHNND